MAVEIKTNIAALKVQRQFNKSGEDLQKSIEKLASGSRINEASDDAAGLAVSERMRARVRSLDVAKRNAGDAMSYLQTSESNLNEVTNMVIRMRELASQAASDTVGNQERSYLDKEFQQVRQEINRIMQSTEFNGAKVLTEDAAERPLQLFIGASNRGKNFNGESVSYEDGADPDILTVNLEDLKDLVQTLKKITVDDIGLVPDDASGGARDLGKTGTEELMTRLDDSLNSISSYRATIGAVQSRLTSTVNSIDVTSENINAARSRIADTDYASETAKFAQAKIMNLAGLSVLTQANAAPEMILNLLK